MSAGSLLCLFRGRKAFRPGQALRGSEFLELFQRSIEGVQVYRPVDAVAACPIMVLPQNPPSITWRLMKTAKPKAFLAELFPRPAVTKVSLVELPRGVDQRPPPEMLLGRVEKGTDLGERIGVAPTVRAPLHLFDIQRMKQTLTARRNCSDEMSCLLGPRFAA